VEWLHQLADWLLGFAQGPWAVVVLVLNAFAESVLWIVPPDALLIPIALTRPQDAIWLAALVTAASVLGALLGHWLGLTVGRPILKKFFSERYVTRAETLFQKYGVWAILIAAFTPIPYKVFTILAGVLRLNRRDLLIGSIIGRGARFFLEGVLIFVYREQIESFLEHNLDWITWGVGIAVVAAVVGFAVFYRFRHKNGVAGQAGTGPGRP